MGAQYRDNVVKQSQAPVETDLFLRPENSHVSAVLYSSADCVNFPSDPVRTLFLSTTPTRMFQFRLIGWKFVSNSGGTVNRFGVKNDLTVDSCCNPLKVNALCFPVEARNALIPKNVPCPGSGQRVYGPDGPAGTVFCRYAGLRFR